jgi:serine protease inhibitor
MYVLIPSDRFKMDHMIKHMTIENLKKIVFDEKSDYKKEVNLTMPKFKIETSTSLIAPLYDVRLLNFS